MMQRWREKKQNGYQKNMRKIEKINKKEIEKMKRQEEEELKDIV